MTLEDYRDLETVPVNMCTHKTVAQYGFIVSYPELIVPITRLCKEIRETSLECLTLGFIPDYCNCKISPSDRGKLIPKLLEKQ